MSIRAHLAAVLLAFAATAIAAPSFTVTLPASFKGGAQEGRLLVRYCQVNLQAWADATHSGAYRAMLRRQRPLRIGF